MNSTGAMPIIGGKNKAKYLKLWIKRKVLKMFLIKLKQYYRGEERIYPRQAQYG